MSAPSFRVDPVGIIFDARGDFVAHNQAQAFLRDAGFSVGSGQRGAPTAVMFGDYLVAKWKNLNVHERHETHATLTGDNRDGPLVFRLLKAAPPEARAAITKATGGVA